MIRLKIVLKYTFSSNLTPCVSDDETGCDRKEAGLKGKKRINPSYTQERIPFTCYI